MKTAALSAVLAAALYAINIPFSKGLLLHVSPTMMAAFLYLGAGVGLFLWGMAHGGRTGEPLTRKELPYTLGMIVLNIAAPILLMLGLERTNAANASLLNNFEIVATSLIARFVFREKLSKQLTLAITLVTLASIMLSFQGAGSFAFNAGSLFVLGAAKTSAYYSISPFLGVLFGMILFREMPGLSFYGGLAVMIAATVLLVRDTFSQT